MIILKEKHPMDCKLRKNKYNKLCRTYNAKKKYNLRNRIIVRTPEEQKKHDNFKKMECIC